MLNIRWTVSIFLHTRPTDMRKGFDGLMLAPSWKSLFGDKILP